MLLVWTAQAFLLFSLFLGSLAEGFDGKSFIRHFQDFHTKPALVPAPEHAEQKHIKYVLITGFGSELYPFYFRPARRELERLTGTVGERDPRKKRAYVIFGNSVATYQANAELIGKRLGQILAESEPGTQLSVVGHSAGGMALWVFAMQNPEFVRKYLVSALFLQSPFQGSPLAEFALGTKKLSKVFSPWNLPAYMIRRVHLMPFRMRFLRPTMERFSPEKSVQFSNFIVREFAENGSASVAHKMFFVGAFRDPHEGLALFHPMNFWASTCVHTLQQLGFEKNDGTLPLDSQFLPGSEGGAQNFVLSGFDHVALQSTSDGRILARALVATNGGLP